MRKTATRRMLSRELIESDEFLDMEHSQQMLYFCLCLRADDDGFVNSPKSVMRNCRCSEKDMRVLKTKNFVIGFESGIVVIRHWRVHNSIRNDRYKETRYKAEKAALVLNENNAYELKKEQNTVVSTIGIPNDNQTETDVQPSDVILDPQVRLGKDSIGKDSKRDIVEQSPTPPPDTCKEIIDYLNAKTNSHYRANTKSTKSRIMARVKEGYTLEDFKAVIDLKASQWLGDRKMESYLRPETLFCPDHFESYLNEAKRSSDISPPKYPGISALLEAEVDVDLSLADSTEFG